MGSFSRSAMLMHILSLLCVKLFQFTAKVWGPDDGYPILALHGWLDNAGSFDRLAPLLPGNICLVCLDFCGTALVMCFLEYILFAALYTHLVCLKAMVFLHPILLEPS